MLRATHPWRAPHHPSSPPLPPSQGVSSDQDTGWRGHRRDNRRALCHPPPPLPPNTARGGVAYLLPLPPWRLGRGTAGARLPGGA